LPAQSKARNALYGLATNASLLQSLIKHAAEERVTEQIRAWACSTILLHAPKKAPDLKLVQPEQLRNDLSA